MKKAKWIILALLVLSLVALFFWTQYVVGLRSAGDINVLQSNHMLEMALVVWCVVFIALVLVYSRLTKGDVPRKVPENPRELAISVAKTVGLFGIGMAIALLVGVVLFGAQNSSLLNTVVIFAVSCVVRVGMVISEYRKRRKRS